MPGLDHRTQKKAKKSNGFPGEEKKNGEI